MHYSYRAAKGCSSRDYFSFGMPIDLFLCGRHCRVHTLLCRACTAIMAACVGLEGQHRYPSYVICRVGVGVSQNHGCRDIGRCKLDLFKA